MRWIQVSQHELETTHAALNPAFGYQFSDDNGESHVKFHADYFISHQSKDKELYVGKNPSMSICAIPGLIPIKVFGQDESVFSQFIYCRQSLGLVPLKNVDSFPSPLVKDP